MCWVFRFINKHMTLENSTGIRLFPQALQGHGCTGRATLGVVLDTTSLKNFMVWHKHKNKFLFCKKQKATFQEKQHLDNADRKKRLDICIFRMLRSSRTYNLLMLCTGSFENELEWKFQWTVFGSSGMHTASKCTDRDAISFKDFSQHKSSQN